MSLERHWLESPAGGSVDLRPKIQEWPDAAKAFPTLLRRLGKAGQAIWDHNPQFFLRAPAAPRHSPEFQNLQVGARLPMSPALREAELLVRCAASAKASEGIAPR